jgi:hypothetical protein
VLSFSLVFPDLTFLWFFSRHPVYSKSSSPTPELVALASSFVTAHFVCTAGCSACLFQQLVGSLPLTYLCTYLPEPDNGSGCRVSFRPRSHLSSSVAGREVLWHLPLAVCFIVCILSSCPCGGMCSVCSLPLVVPVLTLGRCCGLRGFPSFIFILLQLLQHLGTDPIVVDDRP